MNKVLEMLKKTFAYLKRRWDDLGRRVQIITLAVTFVVVSSTVALIILLSRTNYELLYTAANPDEISQVANYLTNDVGITDVKISGMEILVDRYQVDNARMQLAIGGYPSVPFNTDIWDNAVGVFSTDKEKQVAQVNQLQAWLSVMLNTIPEVDSSIVIISPSETDNYALSVNAQKATASVMLSLRTGARLKGKQIEGVYRLVMNAVPSLLRDDITVTDGSGNILIPAAEDDSDDKLEQLSYEQQRIRMQLEFRHDLQQIYKQELSDLFDGAFEKYNVNVSLQLDTGDTTSQKIEYTPSVPESGTEGGMVRDRSNKSAGGGTAAEGGLIGTRVNADISPDAPAVPDVQAGTEGYYDNENKINYLVNELRTQYKSDGYGIKKITAGVVVDWQNMPQADIDRWEMLIKNAIGADDVTEVTIQPWSFPLQGASDISNLYATRDTGKSILIFIIICLGATLVLLFIIAILTSGSKKKRHVRARMAAIAASNAAGTAAVLPTEEAFGPHSAMQDDEIDLPSLVDASTGEAKEAVLKREIREFSRANPEIVAQLIRTWMKSEDE